MSKAVLQSLVDGLTGVLNAFNPSQPRDKEGKWIQGDVLNELQDRLKGELSL